MKKTQMVLLRLGFALSVAVMGFCAPCRADGPFRFYENVPANWEGGCKSLVLDEFSHRLYAIQDDKVQVLDLVRERMIGQITNAPAMSGFAVAGRARRAFMCNGQDSQLGQFDLTAFKNVRGFKVEKTAGTIFFEPKNSLLCIFNKNENTVSFYEADDGDFVVTIELPGKSGAVISDTKTGWVYCNIEEKNKVVAIDPLKHKVAGEFDVPVKEGASAMAVDAAQHRLFLGCRDGSVMMLETNGASLGTIAVKEKVDSMCFDPASRFLYISAGGKLVIASEYTANELRLVQTLEAPAAPQAVAVDPTTHKAYLVPLTSGGHSETNVITVFGR